MADAASSRLLSAGARRGAAALLRRDPPELLSHIYRFLRSEFLLSSEPGAVCTWDSEWAGLGVPRASVVWVWLSMRRAWGVGRFRVRERK